jgi:hypothetical protein
VTSFWTIALNIRGQGIAWDRSNPGIPYGIIRATDEEEHHGPTNRVVVLASNVRPLHHDDDDDGDHEGRNNRHGD